MPSLDSLCIELLDIIFGDEVLSRSDRVALARTSKQFHVVVSRHIYYRFSAPKEDVSGPLNSTVFGSIFHRFCNAIRNNSFYAQQVRVIEIGACEISDSLEILLTCPALELQNLRLIYCNGHNLRHLSQALDSRDPGIQIAAVNLSSRLEGDWIGEGKDVLGLLANFSTLSGLTTLSLPRFRAVSTQEILNTLRCAMLTTLKLDAPDMCWPNIHGDQLPRLRSLILSFHARRREMLLMLQRPMEWMWRSWTAMMESSVSLCLEHSNVHCYVAILAQIIVAYAHRKYLNPHCLIRWLLDSHSNGRIKHLPIQKFRLIERNIFLEILNDHDTLNGLSISVDKSDSLISLPQSLTTLSVDIIGSVSPELLPKIIGSLSLLKIIEVRLICGEGPTAGLGSQATCTRHPFYIPQLVVDAVRCHIKSIRISQREADFVWCVSVERSRDCEGVSKYLRGEEVGVCSWYEEMRSWIPKRALVELKVKLLRKAGDS
jgi:hypothetical protein